MVVIVFHVYYWVGLNGLLWIDFIRWMLEIVSFAFIELSLVVSVLSFGVFIGVFYTAWYNAEKITRRDKIGVGITVFGILTSVIFSDKIVCIVWILNF